MLSRLQNRDVADGWPGSAGVGWLLWRAMRKWLRRLFWLAVLSGAGFAVWTALQRRNEIPPAPPPPRPAPPEPVAPATEPPPPLVEQPSASEPVPAPLEPASDVDADASAAATQPWRAPVDGACPEGFPIKVAKSGIYHVPGGRSYERTVASRCYASAEDAEADGYRRAKA